MKNITLGWLEEHNACDEGVTWFKKQKKTDVVDVLKALLADRKFEWAYWVLCRVFRPEQKLAYAIFSAEQVLSIFETQFPNDKRPRRAIEAAKRILENPNKKKRVVATYFAARAASKYANAICVSPAVAAIYAADAASGALYASGVNFGIASPIDAFHATIAAQPKARRQILGYGISLMEGEQ